MRARRPRLLCRLRARSCAPKCLYVPNAEDEDAACVNGDLVPTPVAASPYDA